MQLLDLFPEYKTFDNFITNGDNNVINVLKSYKEQFVHLIGSKDTGKTHLLQAWVNHKPKQAIYFDVNIDILDVDSVIDQYDYIAIDNIDVFNNDQQICVFNIFNAIKLNKTHKLLLTSSTQLLNKLPNIRDDFKTRILSGLNINLTVLNDDNLLTCLESFVKFEDINIGKFELQYLINHYTRNIGSLINIIIRIAQLSLLKNRYITIPLIKEVLSHVVINNN